MKEKMKQHRWSFELKHNCTLGVNVANAYLVFLRQNDFKTVEEEEETVNSIEGHKMGNDDGNRMVGTRPEKVAALPNLAASWKKELEGVVQTNISSELRDLPHVLVAREDKKVAKKDLEKNLEAITTTVVFLSMTCAVEKKWKWAGTEHGDITAKRRRVVDQKAAEDEMPAGS